MTLAITILLQMRHMLGLYSRNPAVVDDFSIDNVFKVHGMPDGRQ